MSLRQSRSGSALLIVLGFISLMAVSAIAFASWMRSERLPGAQLLRQERGRFLLEAALARAMSDIDRDLGDRRAAGWPERVLSGEGQTNGVVPVLTLEGLGYLPPALIDRVRRQAEQAQTARWQRFDFDAGRFAYLAVDVSDLPDVNRVRAATNRTSGVGGRISLAPFFRDFGAAKAFDARVASVLADEIRVPFVSLLDFNLSLGMVSSVLGGEEDPSAGEGLSVVTDGGSLRKDEPDGRIALTDGEATWRPALEDVLGDCGLQVLDDYLDADACPASLTIPCAERVPQVGAVGWESEAGPHPVVTVAFPFRKGRDDKRGFGLSVKLSVATSDGSFVREFDSDEADVDLAQDFSEGEITLPLDVAFAESYLPSAKDEDGNPRPPVDLTLNLTAFVIDEDGQVVDRTATLAFSGKVEDGTLVDISPRSYGVDDARVNWDAKHWRKSERSADEWTPVAAASSCFVSDAGYLQSVGELAFLPREDGGSFEPEDFDLADDRGEGPRADPMSIETNVLMMALMNTPADWRSAATNAVSPRTVEQELAATRDDWRRLAGRLMSAFANAETWTDAYDAFDWLGASGGPDPFEGLSFAERLLPIDRRYLRDYWRNCFDLGRQLFIVFTRVEYGPRGVAVVGRDPRPQANGLPHPMRILFYHQFEP